MNIESPLRLAVGNHQAGSGKGCAMNVISWENGDTTITDMPACADPFLARVVQNLNDTLCTHRTGDLLCPECSVAVLAVAHRVVGTADLLSSGELHKVYVLVACFAARQVAHLNPDPRVMAAIVAAEGWVEGKVTALAAATAYATAYATDAYATANSTDGTDRLSLVASVIDRFLELADAHPQHVPAEVTERAVRQMMAQA